MPDTVKSLKIENYSLKSEVASLKVALKNLEASIERRLTQASEQNGSRMSEPDKETARTRSLNYLSTSYDELSSFRMEAKTNLERLDKRLNSLAAKVDDLSNAIIHLNMNIVTNIT
jgi:chromosome segregation ATPase